MEERSHLRCQHQQSRQYSERTHSILREHIDSVYRDHILKGGGATYNGAEFSLQGHGHQSCFFLLFFNFLFKFTVTKSVFFSNLFKKNSRSVVAVSSQDIYEEEIFSLHINILPTHVYVCECMCVCVCV